MLTTYQYASNTPIWASDLDGLEANYQSELDDPFLGARIVATTFFDIKHSIENLILGTGWIKSAPDGFKYIAKYKTDIEGNEVFETEIVLVEEGGYFEERFEDLLDIGNIAGVGRIDATDFLASRSSGNTQVTGAIRQTRKRAPSRPISAGQPGERSRLIRLLKKRGWFYENPRNGNVRDDVWVRRYANQDNAEMAADRYYAKATNGAAHEPIEITSNGTIRKARWSDGTTVSMRDFTGRSPADATNGAVQAVITINHRSLPKSLKFKFNY